MTIPGVEGAGEPCFRTRDSRWLTLDAMVMETCSALDEAGHEVSPVAVKATIQLARFTVQEPRDRTTDELISDVTQRLRARRVIVPRAVVGEIVRAYAAVFVALEVLEINEVG